MTQIKVYVAPEGIPHVDRWGGVLIIQEGDHVGQQMAVDHGYELVSDTDERYSPALRRAYMHEHRRNAE